jgi:competence CoiA-like predicted nuclease
VTFIAKLKSTGARVDIGALRNPKADLAPDDLVCQFADCGGPLFIKSGLILRSHFAHKPSAPCATRLVAHPESEAHRAGKRAIAAFLREQLAAQGYENARVEFEVPIPEAGRVADVLVTYPMGWREAHECQLANITPQDLTARTGSYFDAGIDAVWWIGEGSAADNRANRLWTQDHQGECVLLTPEADAPVGGHPGGGRTPATNGGSHGARHA